MAYTYGGSTSGLVAGLAMNNITGTNNSETLIGGTGNDYIRGVGGNDVLCGGDGFDVLQGDLGADTFVFQVGKGYDTVKDFGSDDSISLAGSGVTFGQLSFAQQNGGLAIIYQGNVWMHLQGFTGTTLTSDYFVG
jgi:Ca2+-binding RTX toxin-like protein